MFSGIVECVGRVVALGPERRRAPDGPICRTLRLHAGGFFRELPVGASVAVDGVCLTLVRDTHTDADGEFDVVMETLRRTRLGSLGEGDAVNLERSLRPTDRIDGHFVQGHVDALGRVVRVERGGGEWKLRVAIEAEPLRYVIPKGSIAVDGVSLTVVDVGGGAFSVALIPTTLERTTLGRRREGDPVNIETDIVSRTVVQQLERIGLSRETGLRERLAAIGIRP